MAGALIALRCFFTHLPKPLVIVLISLLFASCSDVDKNQEGLLPIPQRAEEDAFITDQMEIAGRTLYIWSEDDRCQLQVYTGNSSKSRQTLALKLTAPCYFIKSPGTRKAQVFQQDKVTRIIAVLGTPDSVQGATRCGREIQGLLVNSRGKVTVSERIVKGDMYCEGNGLDNFQYSLFGRF